MNKILSFSAAVLLFLLWACSPQSYPKLTKDQTLRYTIRLDSSGGEYAFAVTFQLYGNDDGLTKIYTPDEWGPATGLSENIKNLKVEGAEVIDQTKSSLLLRHKPKALLTISYRVTSVIVYPIDNHDLAFHPILQKEFFQFYGNGLFAYPADLNTVERPVTLTWEGFPEDWVIHNSYGSNQRTQTFRWKDSLWLEAVFVGGDFRIHQFDVQDDPVYVAMRGEWRFSDEAYLELLKKVVTQQRAFWNDYDFDYFTITLGPYMEDQTYTSYQGTGLRNAFALNATPVAQLDNFEYLFSHELMHEWIGLQIKTADPEAFRFWFSEGFTDYFTFINMREGGLLDEKAYVEEMNKVIKSYYTSPVREATNAVLAENFFTDYNNYGKLAYHRGCVFAMHIDWKIRQDSKGQFTLKNAMQDFLKLCRNGQQRLTDELFLNTVNKYLNKKIDPLFKKHIQDGALIPIEDWMLGATTTVQQNEIMVFDLGFDEKQSEEAKKVIGLNEQSNAYKAGVRNGQAFHGSGYYRGRTDVKADVYVEIDGEVKKLSFYPTAPAPESIPQFLLSSS